MYDRKRLELAGLTDFRVYLEHLWKFLGLPQPTRTQCEIAEFLQYGPDKIMVEAFRGVGKSYIASGFVTHGWLLDPQLCFVVASSTKDYAAEFSSFVTQQINGWDLLNYLAPHPDQRQSVMAYDVAPHKVEKSPSLKSVGITGQITGSRADVIIVDDVEIPKNSFTHPLREKLSNQIRELGGAVLKTGQGKRMIYLGTPQTEQSIYAKLPDMGYTVRIWPSEVPAKTIVYMGRLAPSVQAMVDNGVPAGTPVDPQRFDEFQLERRRAEYGKSGYSLQFMLDTSPADEDSHPLKLRDLIVTDLDLRLGHVRMAWGRDSNGKSMAIEDLSSVGLHGDCYYRPIYQSPEMTEYTGRMMFVDPAGQGKDETAYAVVYHLYGQLFLMEVGGFKDGFGETTLQAIATAAAKHKVNVIACEPNYGGGMFTELLKPVVHKIHKCSIEDAEWSKGQKELRIIDTLKPVLQQHRLIVDRKVIEADLRTGEEHDPMFSCFWQMSHITRDRNCIPHEDRLEAIAGAVQYWVESMARDVEKAHEEHNEQLLMDDLKKFIDQFQDHSQQPEDVSLFSGDDDVWARV